MIKETLLAGTMAFGGIGAVEADEPSQCEIDNTRQDAEIASILRIASDAEITATFLYLALTSKEGRPFNLDEYRMLFTDMTKRALDGEDAMSPGFRQEEGMPEPSPTPTTIFEGGD